MHGYIKVYRKLMASPIWQQPYYLKLWLFCLLKAAHQGHEILLGNQLIRLEAGEFITGRAALAEELNKGMKPSEKQSETTWWRYLNNLQKWKMLIIITTNKYSVVSISKWQHYQQSEQQMNNKRITDDQQLITNNNVKKEKNVKNGNKKDMYAEQVYMTPEEYQKLLQEFGEEGTARRIESLSLYKGSTGKAYKNDYLTIMSWERKNATKQNGSIFHQGEQSKKRQQKKSDLSDEQKIILKNWEEELPY